MTQKLSWQAQELIALVREPFPLWDGFAYAPFVAEEITYKQEASTLAQQLLNKAEFEKLLAQNAYEVILDRVEKTGRSTNLLYLSIPKSSDLNLLANGGLDGAAYCQQLFNLLHGTDSIEARVDDYWRFLAMADLPSKWPLPTLFLWLLHPQTEMFVKPSAAKWFLKFMGRTDAYAPKPNVETYTVLRELVGGLSAELAHYDAKNLIDIQSLIWVAFKESKKRTGNLNDKAQIELDRPESIYSDAGTSEVLFERSMNNYQEDDDIYQPQIHDLIDPVLQALKQLGGSALVQEIDLKAVEIAELTEAQLSIPHNTKNRRDTLVGYRLRWARTALKNFGAIENTAYRTWALTNLGRQLNRVDGKEIRKQNKNSGAKTDQLELELASETGSHQAPSSAAKNTKYSLEECAEHSGYDLKELERWVRGLQRKKQAIFYGPPGTGKTFMAEKIAQHLIGGSDGFFDLVQFHPAYAYEDFMQGIRPKTTNGQLTYETTPGRFIEFCNKASTRDGLCVLIIDEINRANLARVFGELMYLLEYRDKEIPLAGGGLFNIPENVRILGTMNTADRSIALVDHALRRRFAFIHLEPRLALLRVNHVQSTYNVEPLIELLTELNGEIEPDYQLGVSYFMDVDLAVDLPDIWQMEIEPYLEEIFYDQPDKVRQFRWQKVEGRLIGSL